MAKRLPASMRTQQNLSVLIEGRLSSPDGRSELVELAVWLIIEEALEEESRDALGRDYYATGLSGDPPRRPRAALYRPRILRHLIAIMLPGAACPSGRVGTGLGSGVRGARSANILSRSAVSDGVDVLRRHRCAKVALLCGGPSRLGAGLPARRRSVSAARVRARGGRGQGGRPRDVAWHVHGALGVAPPVGHRRPRLSAGSAHDDHDRSPPP